MKDKFMLMMGAAAGIGVYMGLCRLSQNKNKIKGAVNNFIDDAAEMIN